MAKAAPRAQRLTYGLPRSSGVHISPGSWRGAGARGGAGEAPRGGDLEISEFVDRVSKGPAQLNRALLFENVKGYGMPVLANAFGSAPRMAWALGVEELAQLGARLGDLRGAQRGHVSAAGA